MWRSTMWRSQGMASSALPSPAFCSRSTPSVGPGGHAGRLPYVKDMPRLAFRSEGRGCSGGLVDGRAVRGYNFEVDHDYFESVVWPVVAHCFAAFEAAKCHRAWPVCTR